MNNSWSSKRFPRSVTSNGDILCDTALSRPKDLPRQLVTGGDLLKIWIDSEQLSTGTQAYIWGISDAEVRAHIHNPDGAYLKLSGEDVLALCDRIGVHPAHLMPAKMDTFYSMPHSIFRANYLLAQDEKETHENRALAQTAIKAELGRYDEFMSRKTDLRHSSQCNLAIVFQEAIAKGYRDKAIQSLDQNYSADSSQKYLLLAPLMLDGILQERQNELQRIVEQGKEVDRSSTETAEMLDIGFQELFGPVSKEDKALVPRYALEHLWKSPGARAKYTMPQIIEKTIARDLSKIVRLKDMGYLTPHSVGEVFGSDIANLAAITTIYLNRKCKRDKFYEETAQKVGKLLDSIGDIGDAIDWVIEPGSVVRDISGETVCNLFANQAMIKKDKVTRPTLHLPIRTEVKAQIQEIFAAVPK